ncbi:DNA gyrase subunit A [Methanolinea mesophila]|uniref:DNA gyrase subunit A n=1 Tax=Methanolinea mesophila TaxID=547055 RepID=UPI002475E3CE|nr:DNA gyrase subunit A [Methanolinea mesophila]MBP1928182.1 DNA gyrase subunit A [Methanolinea mesophila]
MTSEENPAPEHTEETPSARVIPINIEEEMKTSYINYAMSVIIGRAIPDVRDGLKPVHRRSLYAMWEMGNTSDKPTKKSARVVGDVMGKYHPHGDAAIYDTIVKMAQPFSYRYPLVEGQGNFGSIDGDAPAAMRYTEVRLFPLAEELLSDLEKETVKFVPNFDESMEEPSVLPAKVPNLLINGSSGIAVGMATNMPPHNLGEVCRGICMYLDHPEVTVEELMGIIPGPDFPTGGVIMGTEGILSAYQTGHGKVVTRGVAEIEDRGAKGERIIITEIPFQVNKARLVELIANLVKDKKIEGISDIRDESDKDGLRVVVELKKGVVSGVILNQLYKHTPLESTFGIINLAIVDNQPRVLPLKSLMEEFVRHRVEVIRRRSEFDKRKAEERVHILLGLLHALDHIDEVIATIRASDTADTARTALMTKFGLDEIQANAILQMQLRRLAALEQQKIVDEKEGLLAEIARLAEILANELNIRREIRKELEFIGEKYGNARRTEISHELTLIEKEDMIERRNVLVSLTSLNYIKRMDLDTYRQQRRGGKGIIGMSTKEEDFVESAFVANTHDYLLCFTSNGRAYWLKVYDIPESSRTGRGKAIVNLLNLNNERVTTVIPVRAFKADRFLLFATKRGMVIKVPLVEFSRPRSTGINAITLKENDELVDVKITDASREILLTTRKGQSLRFHEESISPRHRNAMGVIGIRMRPSDELRALTMVEEGRMLLTVTESGYGKRTDFDEFRGHGRGTMGVRNILTEHRGGVVAAKAVGDGDEIIMMSASGIVIRTTVNEISIQKRSTRGVRIMKMDEGDRVVGVAVLQEEIEGELEEESEDIGGEVGEMPAMDEPGEDFPEDSGEELPEDLPEVPEEDLEDEENSGEDLE